MHKYKVTKLARTIGSLINVYEAVQPELERRVELRLLNTLFEETSGEVQRFEREFKAIARLDHPNIVKVYDWGYADKRLYYVTELKNAKTLQTLLDEGRAFGIDESLGIGLELAGALGYLHDQGILHRGLSADGVLYDSDAHRPIINEFTVIKDINRSDLTARGIGHLAPIQTTPEMLAGKEIDARADLFLLGALVVRLLARPETLEQTEILSKTSAAKALELSVIPADASNAILKMLEEDPTERFANATQAGAALKEARERLRLAEKRTATRRTRTTSEIGKVTVPSNTMGTGSTEPAPEAAPLASARAPAAALQSPGRQPERNARAVGPASVPVLAREAGQPAAPPPRADDPSGFLPRVGDLPVGILVLGIGVPLLLVILLIVLLR